MKKDKKKCVLVVDDHPKVLKFIEIGLKHNGFNVITTVSGVKALEYVEESLPDIILLDILMPEIDGFEVLRRVRCFSKIPIIAFSASATNIQEALKLGANDFVTKPFQPLDMVKRIKTILKC